MQTPSPTARSAATSGLAGDDRPGRDAAVAPATATPPGGKRLQVVTLDGPAGAGKSSVAARVAADLGWRHLDTGAIFRAITWALLQREFLREGLDRDAVMGSLAKLTADAAALQGLDLEPGSGAPRLDGRVVDDAVLRGAAVGGLVSPVSAVAAVRDVARDLQRRWVLGGVSAGGGAGAVVEGRDMGTVVFPDAAHKIYLDASLEVRAERRWRQEQDRGPQDIRAAQDIGVAQGGEAGAREARAPRGLDAVRDEIAARDQGDSSRAIAPLRPADDAVRLDTTALDEDAVVARVLEVVRSASAGQPAASGGAASESGQADPQQAGPQQAEAVRVSDLRSTFYWISHAMAWLFVRVWLRRRRRGAQHVPHSGATLLVANHQSFLDPPLVGCGIGRVVHFLARKTLRDIPVFGRMMGWQGSIFVSRDGSSRTAIQAVVAALSAGRMVCVFPEGSRNEEDSIAPFERGLLLILRRAEHLGVAVVPAGLRGSRRALGRRHRFPRPVRCEVHYGVPLTASEVLAPGGFDALRSRIAQLADMPLQEELASRGAAAGD